jgi:hypothetical protein
MMVYPAETPDMHLGWETKDGVAALQPGTTASGFVGQLPDPATVRPRLRGGWTIGAADRIRESAIHRWRNGYAVLAGKGQNRWLGRALAATGNKRPREKEMGKHIHNWWTKEARVENGKGILGWSGYGWEVEVRMARGGAKEPAHESISPRRAIGNRRVMKFVVRGGCSSLGQVASDTSKRGKELPIPAG